MPLTDEKSELEALEIAIKLTNTLIKNEKDNLEKRLANQGDLNKISKKISKINSKLEKLEKEIFTQSYEPLASTSTSLSSSPSDKKQQSNWKQEQEQKEKLLEKDLAETFV